MWCAAPAGGGAAPRGGRPASRLPLKLSHRLRQPAAGAEDVSGSHADGDITVVEATPQLLRQQVERVEELDPAPGIVALDRLPQGDAGDAFDGSLAGGIHGH